MREYLPIAVVILAVVFGAFVLITGVKTRPFYTPGMAEKLLGMVMNRIRRIICYMSGMGFEIYKLLVQKKGIIVIVGVLYLFFSNMDTFELMLGNDRIQLDAFYEKYTGEINTESLNAYNSIEEEINTALNNGEEVSNDRLAMFDMLTEQKEYAENLSDRGIVYRRKTIYSLMCTSGITIIIFIIQFYEVRIKYNLNGLDAPVQNIRILERVPFNISIGGYRVLWYVARTMTMLMVACVVMLVSVYIRKQNKVYPVSFLLAPIGLLNGIIEYSSGMVVICVILVPIILSVLVSVYCLVVTYRKWSNKGRKKYTYEPAYG